MSAKVDLRLHGSMDHLRVVWQVGETLLENVAFAEDPEGTRYNVLLAIQEMVTNVLRHAYQLDESLPIEVGLETSDQGFAVTIRDQGPCFDPSDYATPTEPEKEDGSLAAGGYGIMIARMVMDNVDYRREDRWNILRMEKLCVSPVPVSSQGVED